MGILYILKEYQETDLMMWWVGFIGLHMLGILYFGKVHGKIFKNMRQRGKTSVLLNLIGLGFGQAYNRQMVKGMVFFGIFVVSIFIKHIGSLELNPYGYIVFGFYGVVLIDAYRSAFTAQQRTLVASRTKDVHKQAKILQRYREDGHEFAVDTNILMHEPDLLVYLLDHSSMDLYMSMMVFSELDGLKNNDDPATRQRAQLAFDVIEEFQRKDKLHIINTPRTEDIRKYGLSGSPDEKIIGTYLREMDDGKEKLLFLSNDKGARIIARNVGMPIAEI